MVAVGWKVKLAPGFGNLLDPTFLAPNNVLTHILLATVQKNNKIKNLVAVGWKVKGFYGLVTIGTQLFCQKELFKKKPTKSEIWSLLVGS